MKNDYFMTKILVSLNLFIFIVVLISSFVTKNSFSLSPELLVVFGAIVPRESSYLTFVSSMFLHGGFLHILFNMVSLYSIGKDLEPVLKGLFLPLYLLSGLVSSLGIYYFGNNVTIGASGAICGVFASLIVFEFKYGVDKDKKKSLIVDTLVLLGISLIPGVSFAGHFFGYVTGLILSLLYFNFSYGVKKKEVKEGLIAWS